jgi:hypothetical protein
MILSRFGGDAEIAAEERRSDPRNQFLAGVSLVPEPLAAELAGEAGSVGMVL